jgi:uncharacterized protein (DUF885 family)
MSARQPFVSFLFCGVVALVVLASACGGRGTTSGSGGTGATSSASAAFQSIASNVIADHLERNPSQATDLGVHTYDSQLEDFSREAFGYQVKALQGFRRQLDLLDPSTLSADQQLDREQLIHAMDSQILTLDVIRQWTKDPDMYSGAITNAAYTIIKRTFADSPIRLRALIAREQKMPALLLEARKNLDNPPEIFTKIAIEQIDGNQSFFKSDVPAAFPDVTDPAILADFKKANDGVIAALGDYKTFLVQDLLPKSKGTFALGAETYAKKLAADEMIDLPLAQLLDIADQDRMRNTLAFAAVAKQIDPSKGPSQVLAGLQVDHPKPDQLLRTTQDTLDALRQFIVDHHIVTIPASKPATVKETPPFMRSTTSASMDTPGPFEAVATEAYYNMTLPDPRWKADKQADFMTQWYYAAISNVSVHEVYPGHYLQFLYAKQFPSDVRKIFGATSNIEGWAHYSEQMMLDEGFHAGEPKYRLAQLQDALLRDIRFIAGIKMHTQGMSVEEATRLFEMQGYQPAPVAESEAKRGTSDATYGYYTMGKLMILKLRDDYKAKMGAAYSLQSFHDAFIKIGPLPLPLIRRAMLGDTSGKAKF